MVTTEQIQVSSVEGLVKRAKVNELARDYSRFAGGILSEIVRRCSGQHTRVFISKHFPERLVDRDFSKREDRLFMFKLLSFVFEKYPQMFLKDQDVLIRHGDIAVMVFSEHRNGIQQIRLNTFLNLGDDGWFKTKKGRPVENIDVTPRDLMDYVPCTMKH